MDLEAGTYTLSDMAGSRRIASKNVIWPLTNTASSNDENIEVDIDAVENGDENSCDLHLGPLQESSAQGTICIKLN